MNAGKDEAGSMAIIRFPVSAERSTAKALTKVLGRLRSVLAVLHSEFLRFFVQDLVGQVLEFFLKALVQLFQLCFLLFEAGGEVLCSGF